MWEQGSEPGLLSDAINGHMAFGASGPQCPVTEEMLSFECLRCGSVLSAAQTIVRRTSREVAYLCPSDEAVLVTIHDRDYSFHEGGLTIRVGEDDVDWWDFVDRDDDPRR
jgi:hypothetical protein